MTYYSFKRGDQQNPGNGAPLRRESHPDGQPWKKCCRSSSCDDGIGCGFRKTDASGIIDGKSRIERNSKWRTPEEKRRSEVIPFWCIHRQEDGCMRVCAGWHACYGKKDCDNG